MELFENIPSDAQDVNWIAKLIKAEFLSNKVKKGSTALNFD